MISVGGMTHAKKEAQREHRNEADRCRLNKHQS
jgi:hypothetical protein